MGKLMARYRGWRRRQKLLFWGGVLVVLYTLCGFLLAPPILKAVLEKKLPELLHRPVTITALRLNPYALSATVEGFAIGKRQGDGKLFAFDRLYVNLESLSLIRRALIVRQVTLQGPQLDVARLDADRFSFSDLLTGSKTSAPQPAEPEKPLHFSINNIEIKGGSLTFHDLPKQTTHKVRDLELAIPTVSNLPSRVETFVEPRFSAVINGTPISLDGGSKPFAESRSTELSCKMNGINIPDYLAYIPNPTGLKLASAKLDIDTRISYQIYPNQASRLSVTGSLTLRDLAVTGGDGTSYLQLPELRVVLAETNLLNREVRLSELTISDPRVQLTRRADGELLPLALLNPTEPVAAAPAEAAPAVQEQAQTEAGPPLSLTVDRLQLTGGVVNWSDRALQQPAQLALSDINLTAAGLSTIRDTAGNVDLALNLADRGRISAKGSLTLEPLAAKLAMNIQSVPLAAFQPYLAEQARVALAGGSFDLQGTMDVSAPAGQQPQLSFAGDSAVTGLATADTVSGADLLKWRALRLTGIKAVYRPLQLSVAEVALDAPAIQVLVAKDGRLNLASLARNQESAAEAAPAKAEATPAEPAAAPTATPEPQLSIAKVTIKDGSLQFRDRSIQPNYATDLDRFGGTISGLSSNVRSQAEVKLAARVDQQAPLSISGTLNPLSKKPFADLKVDFKNFSLPAVSPYSGKYIGYRIGKGKLNFDLHYQIAGTKLDSSNQVFLDQFTLGQTVDSPDATSLPVSLAIALLKDRSGEIHLDIPVAGDLSDPEFSVAGVVVQVVVNLIAKAATSPFALLAALIPEGVDIQHIPFPPGSAKLDAEALNKLVTVAKVLHDRPGLKMELAGRVDQAADSAALAKARLDQLVRLQKLQTGGAKSQAAGQSVSVSAEEYPVYLKQAYDKAFKAAPAEVRKAQAAQKPATPADAQRQMEEFLLGTIHISADDLRLLAIDRADAVVGELTTTGKVEAGRLFTVEPQLTVPEGEGGLTSQALVQLLIK